MVQDTNSLLDSEREFHDRRYLDGDSRDSQNKYYWAIDSSSCRFSDLVTELSAGSDVLEYGCGAASRAGELASLGKSFCGIDISEVAIKRLQQEHKVPNVSFEVMDAMNMGFPSNHFDLVYGSGIIHHLDIEMCSQELARVLRPDGSAVFWEPLGYNPIINAYRWLTPNSRTPDEHPLVGRDFAVIKNYFRKVEIEFYGLTSLAAVPFRNFSFGSSFRDTLVRGDEFLLKVPGLRNLAWYSIIRCTK